LRYRYTLTNASRYNFEKGSIVRSHSDRLRANVCSSEGMRSLVDLGVILDFAYYDSEGFELEVVRVETVKCPRK